MFGLQAPCSARMWLSATQTNEAKAGRRMNFQNLSCQASSVISYIVALRKAMLSLTLVYCWPEIMQLFDSTVQALISICFELANGAASRCLPPHLRAAL